MKHKFMSFLIIVLPIIAAFNYVVCDHLLRDAKATNNAPMYHEFYYVVISTAIFHLICPINIILICMGAYENLRFWRILTVMLIFQIVLLYGLAVYMSLYLGSQIFIRDTIPTANVDF